MRGKCAKHGTEASVASTAMSRKVCKGEGSTTRAVARGVMARAGRASLKGAPPRQSLELHIATNTVAVFWGLATLTL